MIPLPIALLLLLWHGPSNFERLVQLGVLPEPVAARLYRSVSPLRDSVAARAIAVRLLPPPVETSLEGFIPCQVIDAKSDALRPTPVLRTQRSRDGPSVA